MKHIALFISFVVLAVQTVYAVGSVTLAWDPSPSGGIAAYRIYYGVASRTYTNTLSFGTALTGSVSNLVDGKTYYFAATAVSTNGLESDFSTEVSYSVPLPVPPGAPAPPSNYRKVGWLPENKLLTEILYSDNVYEIEHECASSQHRLVRYSRQVRRQSPRG